MIKSVSGARGALLQWITEVTGVQTGELEEGMIDQILQAEHQRVETRILDYLSERTKAYDSVEPDDPRAPAAKSMSATTEAVIAEVLDRIRAIHPGVD